MVWTGTFEERLQQYRDRFGEGHGWVQGGAIGTQPIYSDPAGPPSPDYSKFGGQSPFPQSPYLGGIGSRQRLYNNYNPYGGYGMGGIGSYSPYGLMNALSRIQHLYQPYQMLSQLIANRSAPQQPQPDTPTTSPVQPTQGPFSFAQTAASKPTSFEPAGGSGFTPINVNPDTPTTNPVYPTQGPLSSLAQTTAQLAQTRAAIPNRPWLDPIYSLFRNIGYGGLF